MKTIIIQARSIKSSNILFQYIVVSIIVFPNNSFKTKLLVLVKVKQLYI